MFEKIERSELVEIGKRNGLSEEQAEQVLEMIGKGLGGAIIDAAKLVASKLKNSTAKMIATMVISSLEPSARDAVKKIDVTL